MLEVSNLSLQVGSLRLADISLRLADSEYVALMGATGVGKTTLLEALCGLQPMVSGQISLDGRDLSQFAPGERSIGYVPQDMALFSTMSVAENLAYGLRLHRLEQGSIDDRVGEIANLLGISELLERFPAKLSGGEARRVALGRALCISPKLLLLDEPLTGLDDDTRLDVYDAIESIRRSSSAMVIHVTHDVRDAERLADRLLVLNNGELQERDLSPLGSANGLRADSQPSGGRTRISAAVGPAAAPRSTPAALRQP